MSVSYNSNKSNLPASDNVFLNEANLKMIWDIVYDDLLKKDNFNKEMSYTLYKDFYRTSQIYLNSIPPNQNVSLIELNKNYIVYFLNKIYHKHSASMNYQAPPQSSPYKDTISNYTNEAISNHRIKIFEEELTKKEDEFLNSFKKEIPSPPDFKLKMDEPLKDTDNLLKEMAKQRNYDMTMFENNTASDKSVIKPNVNKEIKDGVTTEETISINKKITWEDEINNQETNALPSSNIHDILSTVNDKILYLINLSDDMSKKIDNINERINLIKNE